MFSPTWQEVGKLGAIAAIRTFLNYFLERDLEEAEASGEEPAPNYSIGQRCYAGCTSSSV